MNTSGEAAEQVMRMSLEGAEILIKLTGSGAKNAAVLLYSIYKEQNKTRGKERLTNMLRSGKPLKVYTFKRDNLEKRMTIPSWRESLRGSNFPASIRQRSEPLC